MSTRQQLAELNSALSEEIVALRAENARLRSGVTAETSDIVGYYVLATEPRRTSDLWDGELHPTLEAAQCSLDSHFDQKATEGFSVYECRRVAAEEDTNG